MEIPIKDIKDLSTIYPLVASDHRFIQLAAFQILNRALPASQEQISVDVLLDKTGVDIRALFNEQELINKSNRCEASRGAFVPPA